MMRQTAETTVRIRELRPDDGAAFGDLVASTLGDCLGDVLPEEELRTCVQAYRASRQTCYVADVDGALVGYAAAPTKGSGQAPGERRVERLYVHHTRLTPDVEREVATMLVGAVCGDAPPPDHAAANQNQETALAAYDCWGFVDARALGLCLSLPSGHGRLLPRGEAT